MTYQTAEIKNDTTLTPNYFLYGFIGGVFAPDSVDTIYNPKKRLRHVQELVKYFWGRWMKEWLPELNKRHKWFKKENDLKVGNVILVLFK